MQTDTIWSPRRPFKNVSPCSRIVCCSDHRTQVAMAHERGVPHEQTRLLGYGLLSDRRLSRVQQQSETTSMVDSHVTKEEQRLAHSTIGERLNYNEYTTIDWLHDLVGTPPRPRAPAGCMLIPVPGQRLLPPPHRPQRQECARKGIRIL